MLNGLRILTLTLAAIILACFYDGGTTAGAAPLVAHPASLSSTSVQPVDYRIFRRQRYSDDRRFYGRDRFFDRQPRFFGDNRRFLGGPRYVRPRYDGYGSYGRTYGGRPYGYDRPRWRQWYDNRW